MNIYYYNNNYNHSVPNLSNVHILLTVGVPIRPFKMVFLRFYFIF